MRRFAELLGSGFGRTGRGVSEKDREGVAEDNRSDKSGMGGLAVEHPDAGKARNEDENKEKHDGADGEVGDDLEEVLHGGSSLAASSAALVGLSVSGMVFPEHTGPVEVMGGLGAWLGLAAFAYAMERRGYGKGVAVLPEDRFGGGRAALVFVVFGLCLFRIEGLEPLAGLVALSAMALGGLADGVWIALVAERRGLGFFGALRERFVRSKESKKWLYRSLFGEDRR